MENKIKSIKRIESAILNTLGESGVLKTNNAIQKKARKLAKEVRSLRITKKQKSKIEEQKHIVEEKQNEVFDSIHYAKRIQEAILPIEK
ncbi:MAG: hypothetical protein H0V01_06940 [Bacteroidetes bacterium]|nr:hypothetical protein [Bacteroidota bacterium]HET6245945.1 hypothetical protein [Bacteroidia bacterium]